jgi:hypothetical protein
MRYIIFAAAVTAILGLLLAPLAAHLADNLATLLHTF